jgi:hypothetical protein
MSLIATAAGDVGPPACPAVDGIGTAAFTPAPGVADGCAGPTGGAFAVEAICDRLPRTTPR